MVLLIYGLATWQNLRIASTDVQAAKADILPMWTSALI